MAAVRRVAGEVLELKADKKTVNFRFEVPTYPVDAVVSGPNRVLVAEYQGGRVTERDFKGNVVWEVQTGGNPIGVQKLPNGNVFVVTQNRLAEYDRNSKEVFSHQRPQHDIVRGRKLRNGEVALLTNNGPFIRLDAKGQKVLKTFNVPPMHTPFGSMDVLANGHVLIPDFQRHRVVEYDADGKEYERSTCNGPARRPACPTATRWSRARTTAASSSSTGTARRSGRTPATVMCSTPAGGRRSPDRCHRPGARSGSEGGRMPRLYVTFSTRAASRPPSLTASGSQSRGSSSDGCPRMRRFLPTLCLAFLLGPALAQRRRRRSTTRSCCASTTCRPTATDCSGFFATARRRRKFTRRFGGLLARCNADSYDARTRATADIVRLGAAARPLLQQVLDHPPADRETLRRVEKCLDALSAERDTQPLLATARLIAARRPKGALGVLLGYVPLRRE